MTLTNKQQINDRTCVNTTCPYCGVGCGVSVPSTDQGQPPSPVIGTDTHPANLGRLCSKGSSLHETTNLHGRLLTPKVKGQIASWDEALNLVAQKINSAKNAYGANAIAFYASGQLLTEDYYVANKLIKGFIGTANIDTNSRLCMASAVAAYKRAFGSDCVPACYEDLELAELLVLTGSNAAWTHPILYQRMVQAKKNHPNKKIVVIDPRRTATCDMADLHLAIKPGTDAILFNGLLVYLYQQHKTDQNYISAHTQHFIDAINAAEKSAPSIACVAQQCALADSDVEQFYRWFADTPKSLSFYSQGINQSSSGTDKCNAIINCHLATGRIGKPGASPFSITGQPNAMGGREVGGLSNQLAAHMDFNEPKDIERVQRFWHAPDMAQQEGLKAVDLLEQLEAGHIKVLWIMSTNPLVSMPEVERLRAALTQCDCVIVSDCTEKTDTTELADILLPAATWGEKDGTVTNSERRISRQRPFIPVPANTKPDWWIVTQVAKKLGFSDQFSYQNPRDIFVEHAALSSFENDEVHGLRDFDIGGLQSLSVQEYNDLQPIQWPVNTDYPQGKSRMFEDGKFYTCNKKGNFIAVSPRQPLSQTNTQFPLIMNTGRIRDQWHTMTRTAKTPTLLGHINESYVELHPQDAAHYQLKNNDIATVYNSHGRLHLRVKSSNCQRVGEIFIPMHWSRQFASGAHVGALVTAVTDPISGQPESKHAVVGIKKFPAKSYAFLISANDSITLGNENDYWNKSPQVNGHCWDLASMLNAKELFLHYQHHFEHHDDIISYTDPSQQQYRAAWMRKGKIISIVIISGTPELPEKSWIQHCFNTESISDDGRNALLSGRPPKAGDDKGKIICACFQVGQKQISRAVESGCTSIESLGKSIQCGTNCGSCIPELRMVLEVS